MSRNKLYLILSVACLLGYTWLGFSWDRSSVPDNIPLGSCIWKQVTGIACPSCGVTRSVLALCKGEFLNAILLNPFGLIVLIILLVAPLWIVYDVIRRKESLLRFYNFMERLLIQPGIAVPVVVLVMSNWIWNIYKGV